MDSLRWERIQTLFHEAADLPGSEQQEFLTAACHSEEALVADVLALLKEDARGSTLVDRDVVHIAQNVFGSAVPPISAFKDLGPYRIKRVLGEGGMGVVYLAEREDLGSLVAIKILRDAWLSPARRERFASEQRTLAQLNHPSIARLYDADTLGDGTPCIIMEYVDGVTLTEFCARNNCSIERRLQLFRAVCEAVQYAHQHAVIHRDLKPSNVLVKSDGSVRLLDFGIAKHLENLGDAEASPDTWDRTRTGLQLMTPAYAAPEQVRGDPVGIHTDVYSVGVMLYELVAGQLPFDFSKLTPMEAANLSATHEPPRPSTLMKRRNASGQATLVPAIGKSDWADLDVLCLTAMHKDPQRRYRSAEALIRDVDHFLKNEPLDARPDSRSYRAAKFLQRNREPVIAAALAISVILGLVGFFTARLASARDAALAEAARTQRIQRFMMNLFQGGDENAGPADSLRVVTLLERGVQEAQSLKTDPRIQAELYGNLGTIYQQLGKLDRADSLLGAALEQRKALFPPDSPEVARSLVMLGKLRSDQARYPEAEQLIRRGLDIDRRTLPAAHAETTRATVALGEVLAQRGSYDQAIPVLEAAVSGQSQAASTELSSSLNALADANYEAGHYDAANALYRRLLQMHLQLYGPGHPLIAQDEASLGAIQNDLGYYSEAEAFDRQALEITESYYGKDSPKTAAALTSLGQALSYQKRYDEADEALRRALAIQEHAFGPVHPSVAETVNELGNIASMRDKLDEAEAQFRRAVEIYRSIYGDHHYLAAIALSNLANVYMDKKDYPRAEQLFRDVVSRLTETMTANNVNTCIARIKLGRTLLREGRYKDAEIETLAGYSLLLKQSSPSTSFIHAARKDLVADYEGMGQSEKATPFRAELEKMDGVSTTK